MGNRIRGQQEGSQRGQPKSFNAYWNEKCIRECVERGELIQGAVKVNGHNYKEAYVSHPDGGSDILLSGYTNRNRALNGDIVAVKLYPEEEWNVHRDNQERYAPGAMSTETALSTGVSQRTGAVVGIIEGRRPRACVGYLRPMKDNNPRKAIFMPSDKRTPHLFINMAVCPPDLRQAPDNYKNVLFVAHITDWPESSPTPNCCLGSRLGLSGEIEVETKRIMIENGVDNIEFSDQALSSLYQWQPWAIPEEEIGKRRYLNELCIFTMDWKSTLDLLDAISCKALGNGLYEVGVHIADVSYFVPENSCLDKEAAARATCVNLINIQVPMLPQVLCEELCSLTPGIPRLAFSVIWTLSETGEIKDEWCGQTIVLSCCKLTFNHTQAVIDEPDKAWLKEQFPPITNGFHVDDIKQAILSLDMIAKNLRQQRFASGSLDWHTVRLKYALDPETGVPTGTHPTDGKIMIFEFSILANIAVAKLITDAFPRHTLLYRRPCPQPELLTDMENLCKKMGIHMDTSSSGAIYESLVSFSESDLCSYAQQQVLWGFVLRCLQTAQCVCTATHHEATFYHHYTLNVPIYTQFTSPFDSYPDIMVQRILSAAIEKTSAPSMRAEEMQRCVDNCNEKIDVAGRVIHVVYRLYLAKFIRDQGDIEEEAIVSEVSDASFLIFILKFGVSYRVFCDGKVSLEVKDFCKQDDVPILTVIKSGVAHKITIFTRVNRRFAIGMTGLLIEAFISVVRFQK